MDRCPRCKEPINVIYRHPDIGIFNSDLGLYYGYSTGPVGESPRWNKLFFDFLSRMEKSGFTHRVRMKLEKRFKEITDGSKKTLVKTAPLIILTAPMNKYSETKPQGGKYLAHFGNVLVIIDSKKGYVEYRLIQHPSLPENRIIKRIPQHPKRGLKTPLNNTTLDLWF